MTESYDPFANAIAERVNGILKQEFLLEDYNEKMDVMKLLVTDGIRIYNTKHPYLSCQIITLNEMHSQSEIET